MGKDMGGTIHGDTYGERYGDTYGERHGDTMDENPKPYEISIYEPGRCHMNPQFNSLDI